MMDRKKIERAGSPESAETAENDGRAGKDAPIGVFDSGIGGVSVLRKMISLMPDENYIYFGDSANAPYGDKPDSEVFRLSENVFEMLLEKGAKGIVVACNTATSVAVRKMRGKYPELPIVGIEPAIKPAAEHHEGGRIVVMATSVTLRRPKFAKLLESFRDRAEIIAMPCPSLVEYIENDRTNEPELMEYLMKKFSRFSDRPADAVVLGCTHYPFIADKIQEAAGPQAVLYDGSDGVAREIRRRLAEKDLLKVGETDCEQGRPADSGHPPVRKHRGNVEILNSAGESQIRLTKRLLGI